MWGKWDFPRKGDISLLIFCVKKNVLDHMKPGLSLNIPVTSKAAQTKSAYIHKIME